MTSSRQKMIADFVAARRVADEDVQTAFYTAAEALPKGKLTVEQLEQLWYSKEISQLRHSKRK